LRRLCRVDVLAQDVSHFSALNAGGGKLEHSNPCPRYCGQFQVPVLEVAIFSQNNPVSAARQCEPLLVRAVRWEMIIMDFYRNSLRAQTSGYDSLSE